MSLHTIYDPSSNTNQTLLGVANYHDSTTGNYELKYVYSLYLSLSLSISLHLYLSLPPLPLLSLSPLPLFSNSPSTLCSLTYTSTSICLHYLFHPFLSITLLSSPYSSVIYQISEQGHLTVSQNIKTYGAVSIRIFSIGSSTYLAIANTRDNYDIVDSIGDRLGVR